LTNGCPDGDGDGIADNKDKCAGVAGLAKFDGCPVPDTDGDGINDEQDHCPQIAGLAKYSGCPMPDKDKDGIADEEDACPENAGTAENGGCPQVTEKEKEIVKFAAQRLQFEFQSAIIDTASYRLLDEVVNILKTHPQLTVSIEGHTAGSASEANLVLSQQRANAVKEYIYSKGINPDRLKAIGYGATRPLVKTTDAKAGAINRRVEINLSE
ncbi:MAG: OmpA family protein, partial [Chitinophagaceae bacterium]